MNDILDWCQGDRFWLKYFKNELRKEKIIKIFFYDTIKNPPLPKDTFLI